ncbi:MAG: hypothetical protein ABIH89_10270, partial [Elusimicrobiota bacterium]
ALLEAIAARLPVIVYPYSIFRSDIREHLRGGVVEYPALDDSFLAAFGIKVNQINTHDLQMILELGTATESERKAMYRAFIERKGSVFSEEEFGRLMDYAVEYRKSMDAVMDKLKKNIIDKLIDLPRTERIKAIRELEMVKTSFFGASRAFSYKTLDTKLAGIFSNIFEPEAVATAVIPEKVEVPEELDAKEKEVVAEKPADFVTAEARRTSKAMRLTSQLSTDKTVKTVVETNVKLMLENDMEKFISPATVKYSANTMAERRDLLQNYGIPVNVTNLTLSSDFYDDMAAIDKNLRDTKKISDENERKRLVRIFVETKKYLKNAPMSVVKKYTPKLAQELKETKGNYVRQRFLNRVDKVLELVKSLERATGIPAADGMMDSLQRALFRESFINPDKLRITDKLINDTRSLETYLLTHESMNIRKASSVIFTHVTDAQKKNLYHYLRNPLTIIGGFLLRLLKQEKIPEKFSEFSDRIVEIEKLITELENTKDLENLSTKINGVISDLDSAIFRLDISDPLTMSRIDAIRVAILRLKLYMILGITDITRDDMTLETRMEIFRDRIIDSGLDYGSTATILQLLIETDSIPEGEPIKRVIYLIDHVSIMEQIDADPENMLNVIMTVIEGKVEIDPEVLNVFINGIAPVVQEKEIPVEEPEIAEVPKEVEEEITAETAYVKGIEKSEVEPPTKELVEKPVVDDGKLKEPIKIAEKSEVEPRIKPKEEIPAEIPEIAEVPKEELPVEAKVPAVPAVISQDEFYEQKIGEDYSNRKEIESVIEKVGEYYKSGYFRQDVSGGDVLIVTLTKAQKDLAEEILKDRQQKGVLAIEKGLPDVMTVKEWNESGRPEKRIMFVSMVREDADMLRALSGQVISVEYDLIDGGRIREVFKVPEVTRFDRGAMPEGDMYRIVVEVDVTREKEIKPSLEPEELYKRSFYVDNIDWNTLSVLKDGEWVSGKVENNKWVPGKAVGRDEDWIEKKDLEVRTRANEDIEYNEEQFRGLSALLEKSRKKGIYLKVAGNHSFIKKAKEYSDTLLTESDEKEREIELALEGIKGIGQKLVPVTDAVLENYANIKTMDDLREELQGIQGMITAKGKDSKLLQKIAEALSGVLGLTGVSLASKVIETGKKAVVDPIVKPVQETAKAVTDVLEGPKEEIEGRIFEKINEEQKKELFELLNGKTVLVTGYKAAGHPVPNDKGIVGKSGKVLKSLSIPAVGSLKGIIDSITKTKAGNWLVAIKEIAEQEWISQEDGTLLPPLTVKKITLRIDRFIDDSTIRIQGTDGEWYPPVYADGKWTIEEEIPRVVEEAPLMIEEISKTEKDITENLSRIGITENADIQRVISMAAEYASTVRLIDRIGQIGKLLDAVKAATGIPDVNYGLKASLLNALLKNSSIDINKFLELIETNSDLAVTIMRNMNLPQKDTIEFLALVESVKPAAEAAIEVEEKAVIEDLAEKIIET